MNITVKKAEILKTGNDIVACSEDLTTSINRITAVIDNINSIWEGVDSLKYVNTMRDKYIVGLNELQDVVEEYGMYLRNIPEAYTILDETFASKQIDV